MAPVPVYSVLNRYLTNTFPILFVEGFSLAGNKEFHMIYSTKTIILVFLLFLQCVPECQPGLWMLSPFTGFPI